MHRDICDDFWVCVVAHVRQTTAHYPVSAQRICLFTSIIMVLILISVVGTIILNIVVITA